MYYNKKWVNPLIFASYWKWMLWTKRFIIFEQINVQKSHDMSMPVSYTSIDQKFSKTKTVPDVNVATVLFKQASLCNNKLL